MITKDLKAKPILIYFTFLILIISIIMFFYSRNDGALSEKNYASLESSQEHNSNKSINFLKSNITKNNPDKQQTPENFSKSKDELKWNADDPKLKAELNSWYESRGWHATISNETADDYRSYSKEALQSLAEQGDIRALQLLASRANKIEYKPLLTKAAIHGSVFAFSMFSSAITSYSEITEHSPRSDKLPIVIEAAAYGEVAKMRGNLMVSGDSDIKYLESTYGIELTSDENQRILIKANEIYLDLESQRVNSGLGKFDNTIPPVAQAYYKAMGVLP